MASKRNPKKQDRNSDGFTEKLVGVRRTAKVTSGGTNFGFSALVVVGDGNGKIGYAIGSSKEVPVAVQKASEAARREMVQIDLIDGTIWHEIIATHTASKVLMKPAPAGTGIIAGNAMRAVFEVIGVKNILAKCLGSTNPINVVAATIKGLREMVTPEKIALKRGLTVQQVIGNNLQERQEHE
jgi:small subunit ribosomal protein S5